MEGSAGVVVLGIDPGSRCTGYGLVREVSGVLSLVDAGTIRPLPRAPLEARLGHIFSALSGIIREHAPVEAAVEDVFVSVSVQSALKLGQARGACLCACAVAGLGVTSHPPTKVKKSLVGVGRAEKEQVAFMVGRLLGTTRELPLDASDALAVAVCHLNERRLARMAGLSASAGRAAS